MRVGQTIQVMPVPDSNDWYDAVVIKIGNEIECEWFDGLGYCKFGFISDGWQKDYQVRVF